MPNKSTSELHLPDLSIRNFRGIESLSIGRLGRVTLLAGRNGIGKTTVLEAVRVYAARGHENELAKLLDKREEFVTDLDEDGDSIISPDYTALFHGRTLTRNRPITIGPISGANTLRIEISTPSDLMSEQQDMFGNALTEANVQAFTVTYNERQSVVSVFPNKYDPRYRRGLPQQLRDRKLFDTINCESLGPGLTENRKLARFWDSVVLTEEEQFSLEALRLIGDNIERVAVVGDDGRSNKGRSVGRRVVLKLQDHSHPVPLKSLGNGMTRLFAAGLALTSCRNGFLIVDEVENGIHHSVQHRFWLMILRAAQKHNVQVFASTHSHDCVRGFAQAAAELDNAESILLRLERKDGNLRAVEYTKEELEIAVDADIEVR